jgi:hypothetical protein
MADNSNVSLLMTHLPLELRHTIFEHAATRDIKPKKLFRYWFEKQEVKALIAAQATADSTAPAPLVVRDDSTEVDTEDEAQEDQADEDDEAGEDADGDDDDDDDEDEDNAAAEAEEHDDMDEDEADEDVEDNLDDQEDATDEDATMPATTQLANQANTEDQTQLDDEAGPADDMETDNGDEAEAQEDQDAIDENGDEAMTEEAAVDGGDGENGEETQDGEDEDGTADATVTTPQVPQPAQIKAARKWRHIPKFMRITHCPPPIELLLASKTLQEEANDWFYNVAILRIEATGSFAHSSFFEEALQQITDAAFSPMENIRKVEVTFVWDTTWLRADDAGSAEAIFPALLRERSAFVWKILSQAPDLRELTIHWHDSAQDNDSANFMLDVLAPFHTLPANVNIQEHYIAADAKPHKRSIAGKRRVEFQAIVDNGLYRLY